MQHDTGSGPAGRLRQLDRANILTALRTAGALSRADLCRATGLSRTTVSSLVRDLIAEGVITEHDRPGQPHKGGSGRPPTMLRLSTPRGLVAGVDLGHRHIRVATADLRGDVLVERDITVDVDHDADGTLDTAAHLVHNMLAESESNQRPLLTVGMGVPGPLEEQTGRISSAILPGWRDTIPGTELQRRLNVTVTVDNDANMGARGELAYGAAAGVEHAIYVKVSGGVGAGLIIGGRLHRGATGIAGELGHVRLQEDGPVCRCGSRGCLETLISAPKLVTLLQPAYDEPLSPSRVLELADSGDVGVNRVLDDAGRTIGRALADLCNSLNPSTIVVGGALGAAQALHRGIRDSLDRYAQPNTASAVHICAGQLGQRAEVMGAIATAIEHVLRTVGAPPMVSVSSAED